MKPNGKKLSFRVASRLFSGTPEYALRVYRHLKTLKRDRTMKRVNAVWLTR